MTRQEIPVFKTREENVAYMNETLPIQESFDLIQRDLLIGGRGSSFYFVNGFTSEETMLKIMDALLKVKEEEMPEDVWEFANACIPYVEVEVLFDFDQILKSLLSGETCVFIDGYRACIVIDCRTYPVRSVEEPDKDKSLRGSRDGFVETLVYNTAMKNPSSGADHGDDGSRGQFQNGCGTLLHGRQGRQGTVEKCT